MALTAGIITSAPISKVPTNLTPKATTIPTKKRYIRLIFFIGIPADFANSSDIKPNIIFLDIKNVITIMIIDNTIANIPSFGRNSSCLGSKIRRYTFDGSSRYNSCGEC